MSFDRYVLKKRRNQLGLTQQEVAEKAGINIKQYQRFETEERELTDASFVTTCQVLKALEMDAGKYATGEYEIKELIYRGHDDRLYNYDTDEPIEKYKQERTGREPGRGAHLYSRRRSAMQNCRGRAR